MSLHNTAQAEFDKRYITTSEIMSLMGVTRTTVFTAKNTGKLPDPIDVQGKICIWERDKVDPYLSAWKIVLDVRRGAGA